MAVVPKPSQAIEDVLNSYPAAVRRKLKDLRKLIYTTATQTDGVGPLEETLKWGQISYLTPQTKSGTTVRIGWSEKTPECYGIYVHCATTLISSYRALYPELNYQGNRAIELKLEEDIPADALQHCIAMALTYHANKQAKTLV